MKGIEMFNNFLVILLLLFLCVDAFAQKTTTIFDESNNQYGTLWETIPDSNNTSTFTFHFGRRIRNPYSGYLTVAGHFDSTATSTPDSGSITIIGKPMFYDAADVSDERFPRLEPVLDSSRWVTIKSAFDWVSSHNDNGISVSYPVNVEACDGYQVLVTNDADSSALGDILARIELRIAETQ